MKVLIKLAKYAAVFVVTLSVLAAALILTAFIPRSAICPNMLSSADLLCERIVFFRLADDIPASTVDRYADSILLSVSYHFDDADPVGSVMRSAYYYTDSQNENQNLLDTLRDGLPANKQYLRYWHGSAGIVRIMHLFTDIRGMYIVGAVVIAALTALLIYLLIKNKLYVGAVCAGVSLIAAGIWFVPFSLEYLWTIIIMLAMSSVSIVFTLSKKYETLLISFMICGIVTNFLDFLTCETVSLLFPLLLSLYIRKKDGEKVKENALYSLRAGLLWGVGYAGAWVLKWISAAIVLGEDVTPYISEHIAERIGDTGGDSLVPYILEALWKNICCLFPLGYGGAGVIAAILLALGAAYFCFVYRKKGADKGNMALYGALGLIPYIRYMVLHNHSFLHYFFTYRAQAATVLALCLIISEITGFGRAENAASVRKRA